MKVLRKIAKHVLLHVYRLLTKLLPISDEMIIFESSVGRSYNGNPKYIYEKFVNMGLDRKYKIIWVFESDSHVNKGRFIKVKRNRIRYFYYLARAKFFIYDCRQPRYLIKRSNSIFIQTWHGTPLKKLAMDLSILNMGGETDLDKYKEEFYEDSRKWDYLVSQNKYSTAIFKSAFQFEKEILETGYPRNDILIKGNNKFFVDKLKSKLNLNHNKKVILYAPTWRDDEYYANGRYKLNLKIDLADFNEKLGDEYVLVVKAHYLIEENLKNELYKDFLYVFSNDQDIQELYLVSDILITDYSSVMFDYSLLNRPIIFYTYDYDWYKDNIRGFYFELEEEAPGPIVRSNEELINAILNVSHNHEKVYHKKYYEFREKYNHLDDGLASTRIVELIEELSKSRQ